MSEKRALEASYLSTKRVAVMLDFTPQWVRRAILRGEFGDGCVLIKKDYRIPASALKAFLARHHLSLPPEL